MPAPELIPIAQQIWDMKYRLKDTGDNGGSGDSGSKGGGDKAGRRKGQRKGQRKACDQSIEDSWRRVAKAAARPEGRRKKDRASWEAEFYDILSDFSFLPAGRILAGAGTGRKVTLFNCFVMGQIKDDLGAIFTSLRKAALTMQQGGGIGQDFSTLRPRGATVASIGADASGPVSFMDVWDAMCRTIMSAGARRGAMMGMMRCDHPDIEDFIDAKADTQRLRNFNLSVAVSDAFITAVREDKPWDLVFDGKVYRTVSATELWQRIMRATYDFAEPGVIFIDRINAHNNLSYCETIYATNPCGEQPLPPYGACLLGSINLTRLIDNPFEADAALNSARLEQLVGLSIRFLDNIIDVSRFPLRAQAREAKSKRRIGLGLTGLADALIMCGLRYDTPKAVACAKDWMAQIERAAYTASTQLAREKGAFELYEHEAFTRSPNVAALDKDLRKAIAKYGIRNGQLTSIAPTGTISLLAGNISSGIEPVFDLSYRRRILNADGSAASQTVDDYAYRLFRAQHGPDAKLPGAFITAKDLSPGAHLSMQAAIQCHVDSSISKTINCPEDISFDTFKDIYMEAFDLGLKGCTTFRPNDVTGSILSAAPADKPAKNPNERPSPGGANDPATPISAQNNQALQSNEGDAPPPGNQSAGIVYMSKPLERDIVLEGYTYKLCWPGSDHAIYVTINDIEQAGRRRPFEIFINSKNLEHYAWTVALTRMISAVFRRGGDVTFVVEELKAIFDPQGGQWMGGRYVPSLLAAIGQIIETHMLRIGFLRTGGTGEREQEQAPVALEIAGGEEQQAGNSRHTAPHTVSTAGLEDGRQIGGPPIDSTTASQAPADGLPAQTAATCGPALTGGAAMKRQASRLKFCPHCQAQALERKEGCWICRDCGYSRCS